jgi:hypothetical protein
MLPARKLAFLMSVAVPLTSAVGCSSDEPQDSAPDESQDMDPVKTGDGGTRRDASGGDARANDARGKDASKADPLADADTQCGTVRQEAEFERGPVDIVLAIDTSLSMAPYVCNTSMNLTAFAAAVGERSRVVSVYRMDPLLGGLTATLCGNADPLAATDLAKDPNRYQQRAVTVDSYNALTQINAEFPRYQDFLRADAPTHVIVVTDDESDTSEGGITAADFKAQMEEKLGRGFTFHSIVADGKNGCRGSGIGTQYLTLSDQTNGEKLQICASDWTAMFEQLQEAVRATVELPCDFAIPPNPEGETVDPNAVQVVYQSRDGDEQQIPRADSAEACGDKSAWHFDDKNKPTRIELCPAACETVKQGGQVDIAFGCAPDILI